MKAIGNGTDCSSTCEQGWQMMRAVTQGWIWKMGIERSALEPYVLLGSRSGTVAE